MKSLPRTQDVRGLKNRALLAMEASPLEAKNYLDALHAQAHGKKHFQFGLHIKRRFPTLGWLSRKLLVPVPSLLLWAAGRGHLCLECGRPVVSLDRGSLIGGFRRYCSPECAARSDAVKVRRAETCVDRFGVHAVTLASGFLEASRATSLDRWGTSHPMQSAKGYRRFSSVMEKRYGVSNPNDLPGAFDRKLESFARRQGLEHVSPADLVLKYTQNFEGKTFENSLGETFPLRGYEPMLATELQNKGYVIRPCPKGVKYTRTDGTTHTYIPDFLAKKSVSKALVIEVKSLWTARDPNVVRKHAALSALFGDRAHTYILSASGAHLAHFIGRAGAEAFQLWHLSTFKD